MVELEDGAVPEADDTAEASAAIAFYHRTRRAKCGKTTEEFWREYDYVVRAVVRNHIPRDLGDPDDIVSEIWLQFMTGRIETDEWIEKGFPPRISYLYLYDPDVSAPTTFMWEFTRRRCLQYLSKSNRVPTARAYSIQNQPEEEFTVGIVDPETTPELGVDEYRNIEFTDLLRRAERAIHGQRKRGKRDLPWVWHLVCRGYRQDQIAKEMELSEGTISICMDLIREIPEVQALREWAIENGLIRGTTLDAVLGPQK